MNNIENVSCVSSVMNIFPVLEFKIEKWVTNSIIKKLMLEYICTCTVTNFENKMQTKHDFFYDSQFKQLEHKKSVVN